MIVRVWILLVMLAAPAPLFAAQALDSTRAHALAAQMAEDIRSLDRLSDLQYISWSLPTIEAYFGIEFELPANQEPLSGSTRAQLDIIYREYGSEALLEEAARLDEEQGTKWLQGTAIERIARMEGAQVALEVARERGLLESTFRQLLNGVGLTRIEEVLTWLARSELEPRLRVRLRTQTLHFGSVYEPYRFWQRADSLPEPYRTRVRVQALASSTGRDTVPATVLNAELHKVVEAAEAFEREEARTALHAVATTCARRQLESCAALDLPTTLVTAWAGTDVINLISSGAFGQATNRLEEMRGVEPPLVVARWMAQALESLGRNCPSNTCDLVRMDSLATEWLGDILSVEAEALAGRIERTATWNGRDDLTELQRALAAHLSSRDLDAVRALLGRMQEQDAVAHVLLGLIQSAPEVDLVGAVEIYVNHLPEGAEVFRVYYSDLIRAGRPDLAEEMLNRAAPTVATGARLEWVERLTRAGRVKEAQDVIRTVMSQGTYRYPVGGGQLFHTLQSLRMLDEYLAHVRALPTPLERLHGITPLLLGWVQGEQAKAGSNLH